MKSKFRKIVTLPFVAVIKFYKKFISPLKGEPCCRYYPTCSSYALQAFKMHGVIKGVILSAWRIIRCNPWSDGGIDYVPEKFYYRLWKNKKFWNNEINGNEEIENDN